MLKQIKQGNRIYLGWLIMIVLFLDMLIIFAPSIGLAGLFVPAIMQEFNLSTAAASFMVTCAMLTQMVGSPIMGRILSRLNLRFMMTLNLVITVATYFIMGRASSILQLYILWSVAGFVRAGLTTIPIGILVTNWFGYKLRGKVIGIITIGGSFGTMILAPVISFLLENSGWRSGYQMLGILTAVMIPLVLLICHSHPEKRGFTRIGDSETISAEEFSGLTSGQALKIGFGWFAIITIAVMGGCTQSWVTMGATYLTYLKTPAMLIGTLISAGAVVGVISKMAIGAYVDKKGVKKGSFICMSAMAIAFALLALAGTSFGSGSRIIVIVAVLAVYFGLTVYTVCVPLFAQDMFGMKDYGTLLGFVQVGGTLGASIFPILFTSVYDKTGVYPLTFVCSTVLCLVTMTFIHIIYKMKKSAYQRYGMMINEGKSGGIG